jgi:hypothetical protein
LRASATRALVAPARCARRTAQAFSDDCETIGAARWA